MYTTTDQRSTLVHRIAAQRRHRVMGLAVALAAAVATGSSAIANTVNGAGEQSPLGHALVFTRFLPGADMGEVYRIDAGGTVEHAIYSVFDTAILSPDGTRFVDFAPTPDGRGSAAVYNVDGSGYQVLPLPDPTLDLPGGVWFGSTRIAAEGWGRDGNPSGVSTYSRRSSDGGGLLKLTDAGASHDRAVKASPDGSKMVFFRPDRKGETGDSAPQDAFVIGADGSGLTRLSPPGTTTAFVFSGDAVSWSPDGSKVAMALANGPFWTNTSRSVYVGRSDGSDFKRIGPRGDIWDAVWSPDGNWVAFTLASKASNGLFQLFLMHPDGSALHTLVSASDGLFSLQPVWSPDSDELLFIRGTQDVHVVDLWSINVDGSQLYQVTHQPAEHRGVAWLP
jgi:Tol biopolymer transport system component